MKLNRGYFDNILKLFNNKKIEPVEMKQLYAYNHIFLILLDTAKTLGYNILDTDTFLFINRIYSEIIVSLIEGKDFYVEFIPEKQDIVFKTL